MIEYLKVKDPSDVNLDTLISEGLSHEFFLPSIRGKTFEFKKGLNIIVGENGCGKSSLLRIIRSLWFGENADNSVEQFSRFMFFPYFHLSFLRHFNSGWYEMCEMKADYRFPIFNLRKPKDMKSNNVLDTAENMAQFFFSNDMSNGENVTQAIMQMIRYMTGKTRRDDDLSYLDFHKTCLEPFEHEMEEARERSKRRNDDEVNEELAKLEFTYNWFSANQIEKEKLDRHPVLTGTMDEPDDGMDIYRLSHLMTLLDAVHRLKRDQFIVVLHNVAMIQHFMEKGGVNFIEMSEGYLDAIRNFGKKELGEGTLCDDGVREEVDEWNNRLQEHRVEKKRERNAQGVEEAHIPEDAERTDTNGLNGMGIPLFEYIRHDAYEDMPPADDSWMTADTDYSSLENDVTDSTISNTNSDSTECAKHGWGDVSSDGDVTFSNGQSTWTVKRHKISDGEVNPKEVK